MNGQSANPATLVLGERLDTGQAAALVDTLRAYEGSDLILDAGQVTHLGALSLQVIRAAARSWARTGHSLSFINATPDCADHLSLMGHPPDSVTTWEGD